VAWNEMKQLVDTGGVLSEGKRAWTLGIETRGGRVVKCYPLSCMNPRDVRIDGFITGVHRHGIPYCPGGPGPSRP
jgi:hypothetical protein